MPDNFKQKHWLNYHHLRYFLAIAQEGGIAKAAKRLRLGQSTLSTQLAQFEAQLGLQLFERRQKRLHLTPAGHLALGYAQEIHSLGDEMVDALNDRLQVGRIGVQIGALVAVPQHVLAHVVAAARQQQACMVTLSAGRLEDLLLSLSQHQLDLAVLDHQPPPSARAGATARKIGQSEVACLASPRFAHLKAGFPQSLNGQPFIMPAAPAKLRIDLETFFKRMSLQPDVVLESPDPGLCALLAAQGIAIIAGATRHADAWKQAYGLVALGTLTQVQEEIWLLASQRRVENPVAAHLLKTYRLDPDQSPA